MKNYIGLKAIGMGFDAHLTMLYTGNMNVDQVQSATDYIQQWKNLSFYVEREDIVMFGPNQNIPAVKIIPTQSLIMVRKNLENSCIRNPSQFPWNPHITLKPEWGTTLKIPQVILLTGMGVY